MKEQLTIYLDPREIVQIKANANKNSRTFSQECEYLIRLGMKGGQK